MRLFLIFTLVSVASVTLAQNKLKFDINDHNFGNINEESGPVEFTFKFVNDSDKEIKITNVKASCGCTTPGWTREAVLPGDSGYVQAKYNPRNRPGRFRKSLRITTSDQSSNQTLYISGFVKSKPKTPEEEFPVVIGNFRLKYRGMNMGKITTEKVVEKAFDIYNSSDTVETINGEDWVLPEFINITLVEGSLNPGQVGQLKVIYDPKKKNDFGFVSDNIKVADSEESVSVMAVINEYFPEMTAEELDEAPKLEVSERSYDFGKVTMGEQVEMEFVLSNSGKEKLLFRTLKSNCGCITYELKNKSIKKGKSQKLKVLFDTSDVRGNQYKSITIYSNDPVTPTQIITIRGTVTK